MLWALCECLAFRKQWQVCIWVALRALWNDSFLVGMAFCPPWGKMIIQGMVASPWIWSHFSQSGDLGTEGLGRVDGEKKGIWNVGKSVTKARRCWVGVFMGHIWGMELNEAGQWAGPGLWRIWRGLEMLANGNSFSIEGVWVEELHNSKQFFIEGWPYTNNDTSALVYIESLWYEH